MENYNINNENLSTQLPEQNNATRYEFDSNEEEQNDNQAENREEYWGLINQNLLAELEESLRRGELERLGLNPHDIELEMQERRDRDQERRDILEPVNRGVRVNNPQHQQVESPSNCLIM